LIVTSPPYWNLKEYGEGASASAYSNYSEYIEFLSTVFGECVRVLAPDGKLVVNIMPILLPSSTSQYRRRVTKTVLTDLEEVMDLTGCMYFHSLFIWDKRKSVRFSSWGSYPYPPNLLASYPFEWITVFSKAGRRPVVTADIKKASQVSHEEFTNWVQNSIWEFQPASASREGHPAPFPEELPRRCIRLYSFVGDTVLDPFTGSGTTLSVARMLRRNSIGYELNPAYEDLIRAKLGVGQDWGDEADFRFIH
jgi:site-specific DNA-methyltransferase (adenine-specific)